MSIPYGIIQRHLPATIKQFRSSVICTGSHLRLPEAPLARWKSLAASPPLSPLQGSDIIDLNLNTEQIIKQIVNKRCSDDLTA